MSNLPVLSSLGELTNSKVTRQASREITRAQAYGATLAAREVAKVDAVGEVTESALIATSQVSAIEAMLVARTPHAEARLRHIADAGTAGMANIVMKMTRHL